MGATCSAFQNCSRGCTDCVCHGCQPTLEPLRYDSYPESMSDEFAPSMQSKKGASLPSTHSALRNQSTAARGGAPTAIIRHAPRGEFHSSEPRPSPDSARGPRYYPPQIAHGMVKVTIVQHPRRVPQEARPTLQSGVTRIQVGSQHAFPSNYDFSGRAGSGNASGSGSGRVRWSDDEYDAKPLPSHVAAMMPHEFRGKIPAKTYLDGSAYWGTLDRDKRRGFGFWTDYTDVTYCGQWNDDRQHGKGTQGWADGRKYEGDFYDGCFHGVGRMVWMSPEGEMCYHGEYREDKKSGHGIFDWANGRRYAGQWLAGMRHGAGRFITPDGEETRGVWEEDKVKSIEGVDDGDLNSSGSSRPSAR